MESEQQEQAAEQDWEEHLFFSLELLYTQACWGLAPMKETLMNE